jgi:hypothetical protein
MNRDAQETLERDGNVANISSQDDLKPETLETPR